MAFNLWLFSLNESNNNEVSNHDDALLLEGSIKKIDNQ